MFGQDGRQVRLYSYPKPVKHFTTHSCSALSAKVKGYCGHDNSHTLVDESAKVPGRQVFEQILPVVLPKYKSGHSTSHVIVRGLANAGALQTGRHFLKV